MTNFNWEEEIKVYKSFRFVAKFRTKLELSKV